MRIFCCCQMIHGRPFLKKNQIRLNRLSVLHNGWSNRHCNIEIDFHGPRFPFWWRVAKWCWQRIAIYVNRGRFVEHVLHWFHWLRSAMGTSFVNLRWNYTVPLVNHNRSEVGRLYLCLRFVPNDIPCGGGGGRNFIPPLVRDLLLEGKLLIDPLPPSLAN